MGISFFGRPRSNMWLIRGTQIAEYLGCRVNPRRRYENDVCIFVGRRPRIPLPRRSVMDPGDLGQGHQWDLIRATPSARVIASSRVVQKIFEREFNRQITYIPNHHCNHEQIVREPRAPRSVGVSGSRHSLVCGQSILEQKFREAGLEYVPRVNPPDRAEAVKQYLRLDIQVCFRPPTGPPMSSVIKLANAGSFGIPTVAYPEPCFVDEYDGAFYPARTVEELVDGVIRLARDPDLYANLSRKAYERSDNYSLEKVAAFYRALAED